MDGVGNPPIVEQYLSRRSGDAQNNGRSYGDEKDHRSARRPFQVEVKHSIYVTSQTIARLCLVWLEYVTISKRTVHDSRRKKDPQ